MNSKMLVGAFALVALAGAAQARPLLYPPSASDTVLNGTSSVDDTTYNPAFPLAGFPLYGVPQTGVFAVNNNGWVSFTGAFGNTWSTYSNVAFPMTSSAGGMIAPMWDDLYMTSPGTGVSSQSVRVRTVDAGTYVVTWAHEEYFLNTSPDITFQLILYGTGNGAGLANGTIIFCYDIMIPGTGTPSFTAGANKGDGSTFSSLDGYGGGIQGATTMAALQNTGWTLTPNGQGSYTVTQGKLPAPSSLALLALGGLVAGRRRR